MKDYVFLNLLKGWRSYYKSTTPAKETFTGGDYKHATASGDKQQEENTPKN